MERDSGIFNNNKSFIAELGNENLFLLKATSHSKIYRVSHDGKFFLFKTSAGPDERDRKIIRREYDLSVGCDHPHIAHVFLYEQATPLGEGILMEYIEGRTLNEYLAENPSQKSRERIFSELLEAISYLHKKSIVHNDLKPENILISRNGDSLKLIDFGLSDDDAHFIIKTPGCSPAYAAPELKDKRKSDVRSDIYSFGKIMNIVLENRYGRISNKCCQENPEKRFQNIDSLTKSWKNRHKLRNSIFIGFPILLILFFILVVLLQLKSRNAEMEASLLNQNILIENQRDEFNNLQGAYTNLKDSLNHVTNQTRLFERLKKERIEDFSRGFDKRFHLAYDSISRCSNVTEIAAIGSNFINSVKTYYNNFDKTVEGKDISPEIYSLFMKKLEKYNEVYQKEIKRMMMSDITAQ